MEILKKICFPKEFLESVIVEVKKKIIDKVNLEKDSKAKIEKEIHELMSKVDSIEEKYIENKIEESTYRKWKNIYSRDLSDKKIELEEIKDVDDKIALSFIDNIKLINEIDVIYDKSSPNLKQKLVNLLFSENIIVTKTSIEPLFLHPTIQFNYLNFRELDFIKIPISQFDSAYFPICTRSGT